MHIPVFDQVERDCQCFQFLCCPQPTVSFDSNPMLAETFEDVRMKFIAEKVHHQPLVMAYHAEGSGWELYATSAGRTKFWGT
jgi:hypothetical protein